MTSAELITALQATRPIAPDTLRDRVRAIAAAEPVKRPSPFARLQRISQTPPGSMLGVFRELERLYGSVEGYLRSAGVEEEDLERVRRRLT